MASILKHILNDDKSLAVYISGSVVTYDAVKRRIFLMERNTNRAIPDHHYRLQQQYEFRDICSISTLLTTGMGALANDHLEIRLSKVYVRAIRQNDWQELITRVPPLILMASCIQKHNPVRDWTTDGIVRYFNDYILPNAKYTALPYPFILQLESYRTTSKGLNDLHMHLNGAIETDNAWQDFLAEPDIVATNLREGLREGKVREQLEQESHLLDPLKFHALLLAARKIRKLLFDFVFPQSRESNHKEPIYRSEQHLLHTILNNTTDNDSRIHPFQQLLEVEGDYEYNMALEGLMYVLVLQKMTDQRNETIAWMFHFYLLILGLSNRLLVQQVHQYGFEQFQKHTLNGLRWNSEKSYRKRFFQLHGNEHVNIRFLEGKFAPPATEAGAIDLIRKVYEGWSTLVNHVRETVGFVPELKLVAHFIKQADSDPNQFIRFNDLRKSVWSKGQVLSLLIRNYPEYATEILGIDAAASEFDAPPEVFAPTFRMMKRAGIQHLTYHAGEDFYHIISGLRAIFEAVDFNEMKSGDRIGHATATGISAGHWYNVMGKDILLRQGEWLDNLVFVYHLINSEKIQSLKKLLPFIIHEIQDFSHKIYDEVFPVNIFEQAWLSRKYCPILILSNSRDNAEINPVFDNDEWLAITNIMAGFNDDNIMYRLIRKYHSEQSRKKYDEIIPVQLDFFSTEDIETLQLELLCLMHQREIVIETLPTSNVRIGHYNNYKNYHLWNWLKWEDEGHSIPPIVVGSDDAGIFATNIYNEYANIYCCLIEKGMSHSNVMRHIERLDKNGSIYKFA